MRGAHALVPCSHAEYAVVSSADGTCPPAYREKSAYASPGSRSGVYVVISGPGTGMSSDSYPSGVSIFTSRPCINSLFSSSSVKE